MKIELEPTGRFESVEGVPCRIWTGIYQGHRVIAYVPMIGLHKDAPEAIHAEWGRQLQAVEVRRELVSFDNRML